MRATGIKVLVVRAIAAAALVGCVAVAGSGAAHAADVDTFHGQTPARLLDTRAGAPTTDGSFAGIGAIAGNATLDLTVVGRGGVPAAGVGAVALNVTVTGPTASGYLTVSPTGVARPTASNLNFVAGQTVPNMVIVPVGAGGRVSIFNGSSGSTHVAADVLGWFPVGTSFTGLPPARLLDTRAGAPTVDGAFAGVGVVGGNATLDLNVVGRGGVPATGVGAVALNLTVASPSSAGYLTMFPTGQPQPTASNLNFVADQTVPNMVIMPVGAAGRVSIFNGATAGTHVIVDVLGWFPSGGAFTGLTPARLLDSRAGAPTIDGLFSGGSTSDEATTYNLVVAGRGGVPATGAGAVALNVTVTNSTRPGYLTIHPQGAVRPAASNLNFGVGQTVANMVIVPLGGKGQISIYNADAGLPNEFLDGRADVIVDVLGWFPNPTDPPTSYGNNLVLRSDGIGSASLGATPAATLGVLAPVLGTPSITDQAFPVLTAGGDYFNPDTYDGFAYPYGRAACFGAEQLCATFGGVNASSLTFVGWQYYGSENARLIDANGLSIGSRGSNLPGAIAVISHGGCYSFGEGTAASGINLGLISDGQWFMTPGTGELHTPGQHEVVVNQMSVGESIYYTEGDC